nr:hypothetical protein [uncultured Rhodopila sp.]
MPPCRPHIRAELVNLFDRQDGTGADWRLIAGSLFRASLKVLDRLPDGSVRRGGGSPALPDGLTPEPLGRSSSAVRDRFAAAAAALIPDHDGTATATACLACPGAPPTSPASSPRGAATDSPVFITARGSDLALPVFNAGAVSAASPMR